MISAEHALIARAQSGSTEAFAGLVAAHQQVVRGFLRRLSGNHADADDLAQDVFLDAWVNFKHFKADAPLRPWLCGIAYRKFLSDRRSERRRAAREQVAMEGQDVSITPALRSDQRLDIARGLQSLPADQRGAVALCLAADFSHAEAAEILGIPLGTVKSHVQRGRDKLLAALGGGNE